MRLLYNGGDNNQHTVDQISLLTSFAVLNHASLAEYRHEKFDPVTHFVLHLLRERQEQ